LVTTSMTAFGTGAVLLGLTSYIPTYLVRTLGVSPLVAGLSIAAILAGWPLAATYSGRIYLRFGFRRTAILGLGLVVAALLGLALVAPTPSLAWVTVFCFVAGAGFGLSATPTMVAAQASVPWNERGVVTGNNQFARAVGSAVGVAVFGAVANAVLGAAPGGVQVAGNLAAATGLVFDVALGLAVATWAAAWAMPKDHKKEPVPA
jgi:MFS family permease